jgi:hypothetical protein
MSEWVSVEDRLHKAESRVLLFAPSISREVSTGRMIVLASGGKCWKIGPQTRASKFKSVNYWMPMPEPPK